MVELFARTKNNELDEFGQKKPWEKRQDWSNPFDSGEESIRRQRQEERRKRKKKGKRSSRRHHMTEEEYTELSSKADSMLDDLLGDDGEGLAGKMPQVREGSFEGEDAMNTARPGSNPFADSDQEEEEQGNAGEEINHEEYAKLMRGVVKSPKSTKVPKNPFADDDSTGIQAPKVQKDSFLPPLPASNNNPFEDESVVDSVALDDDDDDEEEEEKEQPVPVAKTSGKVVGKLSKHEEDLKRKTTDTTHEPEESGSENEERGDEEEDEDAENEEEEDDEAAEDDDEDIVESSKRLLRMADQRMQYQHQSDEVKKLRETIDGMKHQAEAMSEQLRRAVETKCDLVLSQTEMERCHEQDLIAKDDDIRDLRLYIQQLLESQAMNELHFMNEISSLSKRLEDQTERHKNELAEKDFTISQLQGKVRSLQTESSANNSSAMSSFRNRFIESTNMSTSTPIGVI